MSFSFVNDDLVQHVVQIEVIIEIEIAQLL